MESTLLEAMLEAARRCGAAFASTAETGSALDALIDTALKDNAIGQDFGAGGWVYRPAGAAADKLRALPSEGSYNTQGGKLIPTRAWGVAPSASEVYHLYAMLPPVEQAGVVESWRRLVNRALGNLWTVAELPVGAGGSGTRNFPLQPPVVTLVAAVATEASVVITAPSGWSLEHDIDLGGGNNLHLAVYTRRQRVTDPIEWEFALAPAAEATGFVAGYVDTNPSLPGGQSSDAANVALVVTAPSVTVEAGSLVLRIVAGDDVCAFTTPTTPALEQRLDAYIENTAVNQGLALFDSGEIVEQAGASGTAVITMSSPRDVAGVTFELKRRDATHRVLFAGATISATSGSAATLTLTRPLNLPHDEWVPNRQAVRKVLVRGIEGTSELDMNRRGRWWRINDGEQMLRLSFPPTQGQQVVMEVQRPYPPLVADDDVTTCDLERLALRTRVEFFSYLNTAPTSRGKYEKELAGALEDWRRRENDLKPQQAVVRA